MNYPTKPVFLQSQLDQKKKSPYFEIMQHQNLVNNSLKNFNDLTLLFNQLAEGIICINQEGIITIFNQAAEKILGISSIGVINSSFEIHFNDALFGFSIKKTLNSQKIERFCHPYLNSALQGIKINPHMNGSNLTIILEDLRALAEAQNLIFATDRLKDLGKMTALVAHEIRNPLGGIKGFASLLRRDLENEPNLRQMVDLIIEGTDHLNTLVTHILNFAHPLKMQFQPVDLIKIVHDLKDSMARDGRLSNKIDFKIQSSLNTLFLPLDEELMRSCLVNLAVNAIDAMPEGGCLTVSIEEKEGVVLIDVIDTGIGISKEHLKKIFSAFFTTKKQGNGFGLLEVYKVVTAHKGTIQVDSNVGKGTTFTIKIPIGKI